VKYTLFINSLLKLNYKKKYLFINYPRFFFSSNNINKYKYIDNFNWENLNNLKNDYKYLNTLYEENLLNISSYLNKKHNKNFSNRYWRIIVGPWLFTFISIIFERWISLNYIFKYNKNLDVLFCNYKKDDVIPYGIEDFNYFVNSNFWNHYIYSEIINYFFKDKIHKVSLTNLKNEEKDTISKKIKFVSFKDWLLYFTFKIFYTIKKNNTKYFIFNTYLSFFQEQSISLKSSRGLTIAKEIKSNFFYNRIKKSKIIDRKIDFYLSKKKSFKNFLSQQIILNLPKTLLEYYDHVDNFIKNSFLPINPKIIFTTCGINRNTVMDRYIATKVENKTKLILAQHGGCYGQYMFHWLEKNEIKISDTYLNWGWKEDKKNIPFGIIKNVPTYKASRHNKFIILEIRARGIYSGRLDVISGFSKVSKYYTLIYNFISLIKDKKLLKIFRAKLHAKTFGWNEKESILKANKKIIFSDPYTNTQKLNSNLIIHTGLSTGHLENLYVNRPILILLNTRFEPVRANSKKYIIEMKKLGILYEDPKELYLKLLSIYNDIDGWWSAQNIQNFRKNYIKKFAKPNSNKVNNIVSLLN
jgi:putative transferase (TIGR04331 family)